MYCYNCGKEISDGSQKCPYCETDLTEQAKTPVINIINTNANTNMNEGIGYAPKSKVTALILAIFLGVLGVHRFYVGKIGTGILWLLTAGVFGIGWLIDIILIAVGSFRDAAGRPLT